MGLSLHLSVWQVNATLTLMMTFEAIFDMLCHYLARANQNILDCWKVETSVYAYIPSDTRSVDLNHVFCTKYRLMDLSASMLADEFIIFVELTPWIEMFLCVHCKFGCFSRNLFPPTSMLAPESHSTSCCRPICKNGTPF